MVLRRSAAVVVVLLVLTALAGMGAARAEGDGPVRPTLEAEFLDRANAERAAHGLAPLAPADDLVVVARRHAMRMATAERIFHNPHLTTEVEGWEIVGENVGTGPDTTDIHAALMASPTHRAQLLKPQYSEAGFGVVERDGRLYLTQNFRLPLAAVPAVTAPPQVEPPAPAPVADMEPVAPEPAGGDTTRAEIRTVALFDSAALDGAVDRPLSGTTRLIDGTPVASLSAVPDLAEVPPLAASLAAALIALTVGAQGLVVRRLGLA